MHISVSPSSHFQKNTINFLKSSISAQQAHPLCINSPHRTFNTRPNYRVHHRLPRPTKTAEISAPDETVDDVIVSTAEAAPVQELSKEPFSWTKQWYPVAVANLVDPSRPNSVQLLGKNLVIWLDGAGTWRCFEDRCPHRAAPLSEGKVWHEDGDNGGTLMCSYHGWRFTGNGKCVKIPQAASADAEKRGCSSFRACATTYPITESQGLLYVWGDSGPQAKEESAAKPLPVDKYLEAALARDEKVIEVMPIAFFRDLPYDYQTLIENVADPAHVAFAHHNVQGNRNKVKYGDYELALVPDTLGKFKVEYMGFFGKGHLVFEPPNIINYLTEMPNNIYTSFRVYCIPAKPGFSRIISFATTNNQKLPLLFKLMRAAPLWLDHILFRHSVLDGDNVFLHFQEQLLVEKARQEEEKKAQNLNTTTTNGSGETSSSTAAWRKNYYLPTKADTLVVAFKNWLESAGKGGPFGPLHKSRGYSPLVTDHRVLLNRYEQHTKNCSVCKKALKWIERLCSVASAVAAVGFGAAVAATVQGAAQLGIKAVATSSVAGGAVVGLVSALAWRFLSNLREKFYFVDYDHAIR